MASPTYTYAYTYIVSLLPGEQQKGKLGAQHPDYLDSLQYLAEFYLDLSRHADAEPILIECLERRKGVLGPEHPDTIHTLDLLANLYDVLGKQIVPFFNKMRKPGKETFRLDYESIVIIAQSHYFIFYFF